MHQLLTLLLFCFFCHNCSVHAWYKESSSSLVAIHRTHNNLFRWLDIQRGGASSSSSITQEEEEEEEEELDDNNDDDDNEEEESEANSEHTDDDNDDSPLTEQAIEVAGKTSVGILKASIRAFSVAFAPGSGDTGVTVLGHILQRIQQFWKVLLSSDNDDETNNNEENMESSSSSSSEQRDFANYLASAYKVKATRNDVEWNNDNHSTNDEVAFSTIQGGSIQEALQLARSQSRLLVVMIPSQRPEHRTVTDTTAIQSFLSKEVAKIAEKRAHKNIPTPSFLLWSARAKSPEAIIAAKRLNIELNNKQKRPILLVATSSSSSSSCQILAQHHCNPPPNAQTMASWLNTIRKRHKKLYFKMYRVQKELQIAQERMEGYRTSMVQEQQRQIDLQVQKEQEEAKARAIAEHKATILQRRVELAQSLPDPSFGSITLALRFADGTSHQRQFDPETATLETVFNWVDVVSEKEREKVILTTMNGKQSFVWEDENCSRSLQEMKWGKMIAFRVTEKNETKTNE